MDVATGRKIRAMAVSGADSAAFANDQAILAEVKNGVQLFDIKTGRPISEVDVNYERKRITGISRDGTRALIYAQTKVTMTQAELGDYQGEGSHSLRVSRLQATIRAIWFSQNSVPTASASL